MPQQLYDMRDGRMVPRPLSAFDAIGGQVFTIQYNAHCACVASLEPEGAVMTAWSVGDRIVGMKTVYAPISLHDKIAATVSKEGAHLTDFDVKSLARYGFRVSRKIGERHQREPNYRPDRTCTFVAYMVPQDHRQPPSVPAKSDPPEAVDRSGVPVGVARFMMALGAVHSASAVDVQTDAREFVRACRRVDVLAEYAGLVPGGNEDTPRRTCDRDEAAAIRLGLARKEMMDGDLYVWPTTDASVCHDPAMRDDPKPT